MLLISLDHNYETNNGIHASRGSDDRVGINVLIKVSTHLSISLLDASAPHVSSQIKCSECRLKEYKISNFLLLCIQVLFETHTK